jgi:hypothetical protein
LSTRPLPAEDPKLLVLAITGDNANVFCIYAFDRRSAKGSPEALSPPLISVWPRRLAIGESADALLVALTTCSTPARAALATTFSSGLGWPTS